MIRLITINDPGLKEIIERKSITQEKAKASVVEILAAVQARGDEAVCEFSNIFDGVVLVPEQLKVTSEEIEKSYRQVDSGFLKALRLAKEKITTFHRKQLSYSWFEQEENGVVLGQLVKPLTRIGIYVPGGTAAYPSSVLMNAVPAIVAGVKEIAMVTPPTSEGGVNPYTLVAAAEANIIEIYKVGGAQAIAALAFGTETIPRVDKITGPGNIYVTLAKQQVYGQVDIDMLAGPSEVLIIADQTARPSWVAADLLSQAEHDPESLALLFTPDHELAVAVKEEISRQVAFLSRQEVIAQSLTKSGAIVLTHNLAEAIALANCFAPEHLELMIEEPFAFLGQITNAGAIFLGHYSPEPLGDYLAGPCHILPTGGTARFGSPLGVETFLKKTSVIFYSPAALADVEQEVIKLAEVEGLTAHVNSIRIRREQG